MNLAPTSEATAASTSAGKAALNQAAIIAALMPRANHRRKMV